MDLDGLGEIAVRRRGRRLPFQRGGLPGIVMGTGRPLNMLQKKLKMNGNCASARPHTACVTSDVHVHDGFGQPAMASVCARRVIGAAVDMRRNMPAIPCTNMGMKTRFMNTSEAQK
jgi:hypothetical protein